VKDEQANVAARVSHRDGSRTAPGSPRSRGRASTGRNLSLSVVRGVVVVALAAATTGFPILGHLSPDVVGISPTPSAAALVTADVLTRAEVTPTTVLAPSDTSLRDVEMVSRSVLRDPLPECTGVVEHTSGNGLIPDEDLCMLWDGESKLRGDAAVALTGLNESFKAALGHDLCLSDSYRSLAMQRYLSYTKPGLAATPGRSNHGWGLAIDLCSSETGSSEVMDWLHENGPTFGWDNPAWARPGGSGPREPWHWEYVPGTSAMGTNWD
jgi:zinc D-Ala-D-Ala carboxypeptidase